MRARHRVTRSLMLVPLAGAMAAFVLSSEPRLISFENFSDEFAAWCPWDNSDYPMTAARAATLQTYGPPSAQAFQRPTGRPGADAVFLTPSCSADGCAEAATRQPLRVIHDPYAGFSVVAVDAARNEVVLGDEYNFDLYVYDRFANTPAGAEKSEPKRVIGGLATNSQFVTSLYIDPANGDLYATNNDSLRGLNIFGRQARGNVKPDRIILAPYGSFGLAGDEARKELLLTIQHDSAILAYAKNAVGDAEPVRLIQGSRTRMADPHSIALDAKNRLLYLTNYGTSRLALPGVIGSMDGAPRRVNWPSGNLGFYRREIVLGTARFGPPSVTVFPADASGNVAPLRVIEGPKAQLNWPTGVAVDPDHGEIFVSNEVGDQVNVFDATATGDVAPIRVIKGPRTMLKAPAGIFVDVANDELWVANYGGHAATVYKRTASGDVAPIRVIRSAPAGTPATLVSNPYMIAYDTSRDQIIVPNCVGHPRIGLFDRMADKNAVPVRSIEGQNTRLNRTVHGVAYDNLHDEIVVNQNIGQAVLTFRGGAKGDEAPIRTIMGPRTQLRDPVSVAVDPVNEEIYAFNMSNNDRVLVFDRRAQGDVPPKRVLMQGAGSGGIDPIHNVLVLLSRDAIRIFDRTAQGNDKPLRVITGPHTGLRGLSRITMYPTGGKIVVNVTGLANEDAAGNGVLGDKAFAAVWSVNDNGDAPPQWTIAKGMLKQVRGITLDPKNKTVLLSDKYLNGVLTFSLPEMFESGTARQSARAGSR